MNLNIQPDFIKITCKRCEDRFVKKHECYMCKKDKKYGHEIEWIPLEGSEDNCIEIYSSGPLRPIAYGSPIAFACIQCLQKLGVDIYG